MQQLRGLGAEVTYSDPHVPVFPKMRRCKFDLESIELSPESIVQYDCVLVTTDHKAFDYDLIKQHKVDPRVKTKTQ